MNSPPISPGGWITVFLIVAMVCSGLMRLVGADVLPHRRRFINE